MSKLFLERGCGCHIIEREDLSIASGVGALKHMTPKSLKSLESRRWGKWKAGKINEPRKRGARPRGAFDEIFPSEALITTTQFCRSIFHCSASAGKHKDSWNPLSEEVFAWPVWMFFVFDVQVLQGCNEGLCLEASSCPSHYWGVADSTVRSNGNNIAPQGGPYMAHFVHSLGHTTHVEPPAEVNAV